MVSGKEIMVNQSYIFIYGQNPNQLFSSDIAVAVGCMLHPVLGSSRNGILKVKKFFFLYLRAALPSPQNWNVDKDRTLFKRFISHLSCAEVVSHRMDQVARVPLPGGATLPCTTLLQPLCAHAEPSLA